MRAAIALLMLVPTVARADNRAAAAAEASAAETLAAAQKYGEAAAKFRAAYRLDASVEYLCNVGAAYHRAKELPRAQIYLKQCLRDGHTLDAAFQDLVRKALADVESKLREGEFAPIDMVVRPDTASLKISSFDADESFVGAQVVWLPYGTHTIEAVAGGYASQRRAVDVTSQKPLQLRFELERAGKAPEPVGAGVHTESRPTPASPPPATSTPRSKLAPVVATVVTAAVAGGALGTFLHARSIMNTAGASTIDMSEYDRRIDRARTWQHVSWALAGAAGVGAVVSTILWVRSTDSTTVEVAPTGGGGSVTLSGTW